MVSYLRSNPFVFHQSVVLMCCIMLQPVRENTSALSPHLIKEAQLTFLFAFFLSI